MRHRIAITFVLAAALAGCQEKPAPPQNAAATTAPAPARAGAPAAAVRAPGRTASAPRRGPRAAPPAAPAAAGTAADVATLRIDSDVPGAQVFIDRQYVGVTPVTAPNIKAGNHRVNLSAQGYDGIAENIDVEPGPRDLMFKFKQVKLNASIDVVHKHRIGSCKGRLYGCEATTAPGLGKQSSVARAAAEALRPHRVAPAHRSVLAKTLHVRLAKGKKYDFTDPDGNADRLFVFHRDVDKVRQQ